MIEPTAKHVHRPKSDTVHCILGVCLAIGGMVPEIRTKR